NCTVRTNTVNIQEICAVVNLQNSYRSPFLRLCNQYKSATLAKKRGNLLKFYKESRPAHARAGRLSSHGRFLRRSTRSTAPARSAKLDVSRRKTPAALGICR